MKKSELKNIIQEVLNEEENESTEKWGMFFKNGQIGTASSNEPQRIFDNQEEAKLTVKRFNKMLSPGEKKYYGMKYYLKKM